MAEIDYSIKDIEKVVTFDGNIKNVNVSRLTAPGENFLSLVLRVDFEIEKEGTTEMVSTVAKRLPLGQKEVDFSSHVMTNEIKWYVEVVSLIKNFARKHAIEVDLFPEYCGSRYSLDSTIKKADSDSVLLLENLIPQGYKNEDRYKGFDLITSKAILKRLAMFHAIPLAMKIKEPEHFEIIKERLHQEFPPPPPKDGEKNKGPHPEGECPENLLLDIIMDSPECKPYIEKLKALKNKSKGPGSWFKSTIEPWNTIVHGDAWVNNIMINPREGKDPLVKLVDFQMCTYGSYAADLLFFLLTSTQNDVFKEQLDILLRYYYEEFTTIIKKTGVDLALTYDEYLKEIQKVVSETEFIHALFFTTIIFGEKGTGVDTVVQEVDKDAHMLDMINKMNHYQKDKLILIATEAAKRNWI